MDLLLCQDNWEIIVKYNGSEGTDRTNCMKISKHKFLTVIIYSGPQCLKMALSFLSITMNQVAFRRARRSSFA